MVLKYRNAKRCRTKYILLLPLLMGFFIGILSVYTYYLLLNYKEEIKLNPTVRKHYNSEIHFNQSHYQVDLTKSTVNHNISVLCLIFINDFDFFILQHNLWIKKCKNKIFVSKQKHKYFDNIITDTYSENSWKYYCQTLIYLHKQYSSGMDKYDWIFLAKDNVWLIYENLLHLISLLNTNKHNYYYAGKYINGLLSLNAGILINSNILVSLAHLLNDVNACDRIISNDHSDNMLDFYLKMLNNITAIKNADSYGCTLFHSINLFDAFNVNSLKPEISETCMSKLAITFQLDALSSNYRVMYYKYVLYKVRIISEKDISLSNNVIKAPTPKDRNIWQLEALYELNLDPTNMSQKEFFNFWWKKRQIIL